MLRLRTPKFLWVKVELSLSNISSNDAIGGHMYYVRFFFVI